MNLLGNRIWIKRDQTSETSEGGIILLQKSQKKKQTGTVAFVGDTADQTLKDSRVLFDPNCGSPVEHEGEEYLSIFKSDIWATLKN